MLLFGHYFDIFFRILLINLGFARKIILLSVKTFVRNPSVTYPSVTYLLFFAKIPCLSVTKSHTTP